MDSALSAIEQFLEAGNIKKAEVQIAKLLREDPDPALRARLLCLRARARLIGLHPDDALEDIQTARALDPALAETPETLELLADIYFARFELSPVGFAERADADNALALYERIISEFPDYQNMGWVLYQKGRVHLSAGNPDEATACLQDALLRPSKVAALTAFCYERLGFIHLFDYRDTNAALSFLNKAAVTYPADEPEAWLGQLHILRSRALKEQGNYDEALEAASQALTIMERLGPEMRGGKQDAHLALGEILATIPGREQEAVNHLQQFLQAGKKPLGVDVTWSRVNELLGNLLFQLQRYDSAIEAYNYALDLNPYHPWQGAIYYQIARCYYRLRMYEETIATIDAMRQAAENEQQELTDYRVFHLLGNAHFALEHYNAAGQAYRKALELAPDQAEDRDRIATYLRFSEELAGDSR